MTENVNAESDESGTEENDYSKSIAIVYPVSWPAPTEDVPDPHSTIIYLGQIGEVDFTLDDVKAAMKEFIWEPFNVAIGEVKVLGENEDVPAVTLLSQALYINRQMLEEELNKRGIESASQFEYLPHITVDRQSMAAMPFNTITLYKPQIWWGNQKG